VHCLLLLAQLLLCNLMLPPIRLHEVDACPLLCNLMLPPIRLHEVDARARIGTYSPCQLFHHLLQGRCVPSCPENTIGLLLYRLVITNALIINACDLGRGLILRHFTEQAYDPPDASGTYAVLCTSRRHDRDRTPPPGLVKHGVGAARKIGNMNVQLRCRWCSR
jgi:hypothetical protein